MDYIDKTDWNMINVKKGYQNYTQVWIEHIFGHETYTSYMEADQRIYVSKFNEGHFIHYYFRYTEKTVTLVMRILPTPYDTKK